MIHDRYQGLACAVGAWAFENWAQDNRWMDEYLATWFRQRYWEITDLSADELDDIGYAQVP